MVPVSKSRMGRGECAVCSKHPCTKRNVSCGEELEEAALWGPLKARLVDCGFLVAYGDSVIQPTLPEPSCEQVPVINSINQVSWGGHTYRCCLAPRTRSRCFTLVIQTEVAPRCCGSSVLAEMILCAISHREMLLLCLVAVEKLVRHKGIL